MKRLSQFGTLITLILFSIQGFSADVMANYLSNTRAPETNWASSIRSSKLIHEEIEYDDDGNIINIKPLPVDGKRVVDPLITELNNKDLIAVLNPNKCHYVFGDKNSNNENTYYKQTRRDANILLSYLRDTGSASKVYFQLGNEVNDYIEVKTISDWVLDNKGIDLGCEKDSNEKYRPDCNAIIPYIVEYCVAPALAAINSLHSSLTDDRAYIMMPSIATAHRPSARDWLKELAKYEIQASELINEAGKSNIINKQMGEVSDVASVHYIMTGDSHYRDPDGKKTFNPMGFIDAMDELYDAFLNPDTRPSNYKFTGVWSSEEQGSRRAWKGLGAATAVTVFARYNHYWNLKKMNSDQGRANYYGVERHSCKRQDKTILEYCDESLSDEELNQTKGSFSMGLISSFLPSKTRLSNLKGVTADLSDSEEISKTADFEFFGFKNGTNDRRIVVVSPVQQAGGKKISSITVPNKKWNDVNMNVKGHIFIQNGYKYLRSTDFEVVPVPEENSFKIIFDNSEVLEDGSVLLLTIRKN